MNVITLGREAPLEIEFAVSAVLIFNMVHLTNNSQKLQNGKPLLMSLAQASANR